MGNIKTLFSRHYFPRKMELCIMVPCILFYLLKYTYIGTSKSKTTVIIIITIIIITNNNNNNSYNNDSNKIMNSDFKVFLQ